MKLRVKSGGDDPPSTNRKMIRVAKPTVSSSLITHPFGPTTQMNAGASAPIQEEEITISDPKGLKTGKYSKSHINGIIKASRIIGVDPNTAVALALQESNLGKAKIKTRRGEVQGPLAMVNQFSDEQQKELDEKAKTTGVGPEYLKLAIALRDKLKYADQLGFKDEASKLQAYNGYGMITQKKFGGTEKAYGIPIGAGLDMKKNPLYGKRLLELKEGIAGNKDISNLVSESILFAR